MRRIGRVDRQKWHSDPYRRLGGFSRGNDKNCFGSYLCGKISANAEKIREQLSAEDVCKQWLALV